MTAKSIDRTPIKIAVASSDGKFVDRHFGAAHQFVIFEYDGKGFTFLELRKSPPLCRGDHHDDDDLARTAQLIGDCSYVIANRVGPRAVPSLLAKGIRAYMDADFVESSLEKLKATGKLRHVLKK